MTNNFDGLKESDQILAWISSWHPSFEGKAIVSKDFKFLGVNPRFCEIVKATPAEIMGGTFIKDANGEYIKQERKEFPYLEIQRILAHYVARDENAFTLRDTKIDEVKALTSLEEIEAYDTNSIY